MPRFPLERYSGYVHIDREAKEDDHDRFEKRKGEKLDETRGGKCLEKMFKEREKSSREILKEGKIRGGKSLEKDLRSEKNRDLKKEKDSIKLEEGKV